MTIEQKFYDNYETACEKWQSDGMRQMEFIQLCQNDAYLMQQFLLSEGQHLAEAMTKTTIGSSASLLLDDQTPSSNALSADGDWSIHSHFADQAQRIGSAVGVSLYRYLARVFSQLDEELAA